MKVDRLLFVYWVTIALCTFGCKTKTVPVVPNAETDSSLINTNHLDHLYVPVTFMNGTKAAGIYIYAEAPDYHLVGDSDEGFTCIDDVSRAALFYLRSDSFSADTIVSNKVISLLEFILQMQAGNGYFYNFLLPGGIINKEHQTSRPEPNWWSWRALQTLTEAVPLLKNIDALLSRRVDTAINKLLRNIKSDLVRLPLKTKLVDGVTVPQWLPAGSASDQAAILLLALINHCSLNNDAELEKYIRSLADGISMMQAEKTNGFPFSCILSWENVWHAYGCDQAFALMKASTFLKDSTYLIKALAEVNNFYPWLLSNGMKSSFKVERNGNEFKMFDAKDFEQIAYGIRPMIFAATEAYDIRKDKKYAAIAGQLSSWFFGKNAAHFIMYDKYTGRGFDGIIGAGKVNKNSGAESTIEALLALQRLENYPVIKPGFIKESQATKTILNQ